MGQVAPRDAFSVSQVNEYIKMLLEGNPALRSVWVCGEVSGAKLYSSGHLYFSLKDEDSVLSAVMFRSSVSGLDFRPEDGMRVLVHGRLSAYVPRGQYQLVADRMIPDGAGAMALAFEQLKRRLESEGLFAPERKKPIPPHPKRIGIVTSPSGAAVHDIIRVAGGRNPSVELLIFPSLVQGDQAAAYLAGGIRYFNTVKDDPEQGVDFIIIGRGGGSAEDLWAFNDEHLARTIAASELPVVSAVGHEVDFSICDFVADLRAATPSAAAELTVPDRGALNRYVQSLAVRLYQPVEGLVSRHRALLDRLAGARVLTSPEATFVQKREAVASLEGRMERSEQLALGAHAEKLKSITAQLEALSPLSVLSRGYTLVKDGEDRVVTSAAMLTAGDHVSLRFADGQARAVVTDAEMYDRGSKD